MRLSAGSGATASNRHGLGCIYDDSARWLFPATVLLDTASSGSGEMGVVVPGQG